ncbi:MAG TPA: hypothetical protein VMU39_02935 [Solirubrobacteraceae bacterium]|nr:hypothetical protein [Solirubrobacteraceae bacterium]
MSEAARRMGHSGTLHLAPDAHVIESVTGRLYADLDALIAAARTESDVPQKFAAESI